MTLDLEALVAAGKWDEVETLALATWRATREPGLAVLLAAIAARRPARLTVPNRTVAAALAWLDLVPSDPDPRTGQFLVDMFAAPPMQGLTSKGFWRRVFEVMKPHLDGGTVAQLEALRSTGVQRTGSKTMGAWFDKLLETSLEALRQATSQPDEDQRYRMWAEQLAIAPIANRGGDLFAGVYAAPNSDAPRAVLADQLQERGDPRGELIALQLANEQPKRVAALLHKHERAWLGVLRPVFAAKHIVWERGFPVAARIRPRSGGDLSRALDAPEWATLRAVLVEYNTQGIHDLIAELFDRTPHLQVVGGDLFVMSSVLGAMKKPASWRTLLVFSREVRPGSVPVLTQAALPNLERLIVVGSNDWRGIDSYLTTLAWIPRIEVDIPAVGANIHHIPKLGAVLPELVRRARADADAASSARCAI